jgi:membrane protein DedA with SNARE-associated domain
MTAGELTLFLQEYGYAIVFILMIAEGPLTTLVAAFLASTGVFNVYVIFLLSFLGDILGDTLFYALGRYGGHGFVRKYGKYVGLSDRRVKRLEKFFGERGRKTVFTAKSTTGFGILAYVTAGVVKMPFGQFLQSVALGGVIWSALLVVLGYFFGEVAEQVSEYLQYGALSVGISVIVIFFGIQYLKKKRGKDVFDENDVKKAEFER